MLLLVRLPSCKLGISSYLDLLVLDVCHDCPDAKSAEDDERYKQGALHEIIISSSVLVHETRLLPV
jgi:hypothetical protein